MARYIVAIAGGRVTAIEEFPDEDDEALGIEWALSELKDSYRHAKQVDGSYSLAGRDELSEFLAYLEKLLGPDAVSDWQTKYSRS